MSGSKIYFISGANNGIGFSLLKELSNDESNVVIGSARKPEEAVDLQNLAKERKNVRVVKLNITSKQSTTEAAEEVSKITGKIDVLISNAGVSYAYGSVLETNEDVWVQHWQTNVLGSIFLYQSFYPLLEKGNAKQMMFISSGLGSIGGYIGMSASAYGQSKAALNYTVKEISVELKDKGFTVVAVHPGQVSTETGKLGHESLVAAYPHLKEMLEKYVITPQEGALSLKTILEKLNPEHNGKFLNNDGTELPW